MRKIIEKLSNIPIIFTIILLSLTVLISFVLTTEILGWPYEYAYIFCSIISILVGLSFRMPEKMRITTRFKFDSLKFYFLPLIWLLLAPIILFGGYNFSLVTKELIIMMTGVGIYEEILTHGICMGLLVNKWGDKHKIKAAIVSAICFGFAHLIAILQDPTNSSLILKQCSTVIFSTFISIGFAGLAYKSNSIWLTAAFHGLLDIIGNVGKEEIINNIFQHWTWNYTLISILYTFPFGLYGIWLLKGTRVKKISAPNEKIKFN